jgi:signal transduction histidine kinase
MAEEGRARTVAQVDQLSFGKHTRPATDRDDAVSRLSAVLRTVASGWVASATWRGAANLLLWLAMSWGVAVIAFVGLLVSLATAWVIGLGIWVRASVLRLLAELVGIDRRRLHWLLGVRTPPLALPRSDPDASRQTRQRAWAQAPPLWRLPAYEIISVPVVTALALGAVAWWWATIACFALADRHSELALQPVHVLGVAVGPWSVSTIETVGLVIAGVAGVLLWPMALRAISTIDVTLARGLLGPNSIELSQEVVRLSETRAQAVAAADAERRRIERDLHDGFQPQLVNLALSLGLAKSRLANDPEAARALLERAHQDAKRATEDLRNLVRGIHPSVLDERGLDAAFSALAAGSSIPLQIDVHLEQRPPRDAEAIAYFVVAEAITNINKHAGAQTAAVTVNNVDGALWILVQDDGQGGAQVEPGGGLDGLSARIAAVDGTFSLTSPAGGPTWIEARIPCEW